MNETINEILDYISDRVIQKEKWNKVKDYITNLQQENKEANDSITWWTNRFKAVERDNRELQQRIAGLEVENETLRSDFKNQVEYTNKIAEENERLKEVVENLTTMTVCGDRKQIKNTAQFKLEQCQSRIDKAVEILKERKK